MGPQYFRSRAVMFRRDFLKTAIDCISGLVTATIALPGLRFLFDPLRSRRRDAGFVRVARLADLAAGEPVRVVVTADRWDGFVHHPPGPVGSVWVVSNSHEGHEAAAEPSGGSDSRVDAKGAGVDLKCYQSICPHLGCGTDFNAARRLFTCPCHASDFDLAGRVLSGPSPRGLDELSCRISDPDPDGALWVEVEYREFKTGVAGREPLV